MGAAYGTCLQSPAGQRVGSFIEPWLAKALFLIIIETSVAVYTAWIITTNLPQLAIASSGYHDNFNVLASVQYCYVM